MDILWVLRLIQYFAELSYKKKKIGKFGFKRAHFTDHLYHAIYIDLENNKNIGFINYLIR